MDIRVPLVVGARVEYSFKADQNCDLQTSVPIRTARYADAAGQMRAYDEISGVYEAPLSQDECPRDLVFTFSNPPGVDSTTVQYRWTRQLPARADASTSRGVRSGRRGHRPGQESMVAEQERRRLEKAQRTWKRAPGAGSQRDPHLTSAYAAAPSKGANSRRRTPSGVADASLNADDDEQNAIKMAIDMTGEPQLAHIVNARKEGGSVSSAGRGSPARIALLGDLLISLDMTLVLMG